MAKSKGLADTIRIFVADLKRQNSEQEKEKRRQQAELKKAQQAGKKVEVEYRKLESLRKDLESVRKPAPAKKSEPRREKHKQPDRPLSMGSPKSERAVIPPDHVGLMRSSTWGKDYKPIPVQGKDIHGGLKREKIALASGGVHVDSHEAHKEFAKEYLPFASVGIKMSQSADSLPRRGRARRGAT